jgi:hypothetical protein
MLRNSYHNSDQNHKICTCSLCIPESNGYTGNERADNIKFRLQLLPEIKARDGFDARMAAAFALELENEIALKNKCWLKKNKKILLPDLISDFTGKML